MARSSPAALDSAVRGAMLPLTGAATDYDALLDRIGGSRLVLIGEASHGTHEFYKERAFLTKRLIREKGFNAVAVEADWPDAFRVNRFVRGSGEDTEATDALAGFKRFPTWMWRNADVLDFVGWLREHNESAPRREVGFYGLDLYSLSASIAAVLQYLDKVDPEGAKRARGRYACFEHFGEEPQEYGMAAGLGLAESCENDVVAQLVELRRKASEYAARDGRVAEDEYFVAVENARLVKNAEEYYRAMFRGRVLSWNLRDRHMAETLEALVANLASRGPAKVVVWEHNSHIGDASATELGDAGEWNVGQLVRALHGDDAFLVGLTTHTGSVTAASAWDGPAERKRVRPSLAGSWERLFHDAALPRFLLPIRGAAREAGQALDERLLERAIGVIYLPETERASHYFHATLARQFDAVLHFDETRAVEPLERTAPWTDEPPETYPSGL
jgi:erythromycin esterase-like protein